MQNCFAYFISHGLEKSKQITKNPVLLLQINIHQDGDRDSPYSLLSVIYGKARFQAL